MGSRNVNISIIQTQKLSLLDLILSFLFTWKISSLDGDGNSSVYTWELSSFVVVGLLFLTSGENETQFHRLAIASDLCVRRVGRQIALRILPRANNQKLRLHTLHKSESPRAKPHNPKLLFRNAHAPNSRLWKSPRTICSRHYNKFPLKSLGFRHLNKR